MLNTRTLSIVLALILSISIFPVLGLPNISSSSEARETHVASIIRTSNQWILPDRNGYVPSKPLLHHWLSVITSYITGSVDEFSSRFPSASLGILLVVVLFVFSVRLFSLRFGDEDKARSFAILISFIVISTYGFSSMLFFSMVDMTFATFVVLAILAMITPIFENVIQNKATIFISESRWFVFFVLCGLATLAKGPLGLILPLLIISVIFLSLYGFKSAIIFVLKPKWGWLAYAMLACPWYYLAQHQSKSAFVERQILFENIKRFLGGDNINAEPFWFYIPSFIMKAAPWSLLFVILLIWFLRDKSRQDFSRKIGLALIRGIFAALVFFSISKGKRHSYLLPLFPLITFTGVWIYCQWLESRKDGVGDRLTTLAHKIFNVLIIFISFTSLVLFCVAAVELIHNIGFSLAGEWLRKNAYYLLPAPLLALTLYLILYRNSGQPKLRSLVKLFVYSALFSSIFSAYSGIRAVYKDYPQMAQRIKSQAASREIIAVRDRFDELLDPIFFYLGFPIKVVAPGQLGTDCIENALYISRRSNFTALNSSMRLKEESYLEEKVGKQSSIQDRSISLFTCLQDQKLS